MTSEFSFLALPLLAVALSSGAASGAEPPQSQIEALAWMAGSWASEADGVRTEEHWMAPLGGSMVGMHRDVAPGGKVAFEFLRIASIETGLAYLASPGGRPPTPFPMKQLETNRVVFENPSHDFPQRILYWLDDDGRMHARIEGTMNGKEESVEWVWTKDSLDSK